MLGCYAVRHRACLLVDGDGSVGRLDPDHGIAGDGVAAGGNHIFTAAGLLARILFLEPQEPPGRMDLPYIAGR